MSHISLLFHFYLGYSFHFFFYTHAKPWFICFLLYWPPKIDSDDTAHLSGPTSTTGTILNWSHWGRNICKWDLVLTTTTSVMSYFRHKHPDCACRSVEDWNSVNVRWGNAMWSWYLIENCIYLYFQKTFIFL